MGTRFQVATHFTHSETHFDHFSARPDYKRLSELKDTFRGVQIMALTATATNRVRFDVARLLKLADTKWYSFCSIVPIATNHRVGLSGPATEAT